MGPERKNLISWTSSKLKKFSLQYATLRNEQIKEKMADNIDKHICNMRYVSRIYILKKKTLDTSIRRETTQFKKGQKIGINILSKKKDEWLTSTWKNAKDHWSLLFSC